MGAAFVSANGLRFAYVKAGPDDGPLALCLHGFPDTATTWRHLLTRLADAGFRAVAPWLRGYVPSQIPPDGRYDIDVLAADANALHDALGGDEHAVLVGHDWGAITTYHAMATAQNRWARGVTLAVPPESVMLSAATSLRQLRRSWYMAYFQVPGIERRVRRDDFALIRRLWRDWSPRYDMEPEDRQSLWATLRSPGALEAMLGYYRALPKSVGFPPSFEPVLPPQPLLYLQGAEDGCVAPELYLDARKLLSTTGSAAALIPRAGHFLHLERPDDVGERIVEFLTAS